MSLQPLIQKLSDAEEPSRKFDTAIAIALGFESFEEEGTRKVLWLHPHSKTPTRIPWYTRSLDEAKELLDVILPNSAVALSWTAEGLFYAKIEGGDACRGATGPLAICIAALSYHNSIR
ncbi:hypothetical protein [Neorhizobium sp. DAR64861/K0K2]|uniref:hypothetical protein n=1 Tax=unclassified Neorhizobium TaxID=2629175 RepID=UPI00120EC1D9|nr:MAG: hypothetical protein EOP14_02985 [Pseudomonas sp.]